MKVRGKVNVWFPEKQFGFIYWVSDSGKMISHFLHIANITSGRENVKVGAEVSFFRVETKKGWLAAEVEVGGAE